MDYPGSEKQVVSGSAQQYFHVTTLQPSSMAMLEITASQGPKVTAGFSMDEVNTDRGLKKASMVPEPNERPVDYDSATPSTSPSRSPSPLPSPRVQRTLLDKPLEELTEEDIMHLTREDCRRYLKEKGMRRPSWNKSQAIQQVLSLKGLFDCKDDAVKGVQPSCIEKHMEESPVTQDVPDVQQTRGAPHAATMHQSLSMLNVEHEMPREVYSIPEGVPQRHAKNKEIINFPSQGTCCQCAQIHSVLEMEPSSQLTIFYSGMVNVYDNIPADKAKAVMLLAARSNNVNTSLCSHVNALNNISVMKTLATVSSRPIPQYVHNTLSATEVPLTAACSSVPMLSSHGSGAMHPEPQPSRRTCLQRYLEKRRGRYNVRAPYPAFVKGTGGDDLSYSVPK